MRQCINKLNYVSCSYWRDRMDWCIESWGDWRWIGILCANVASCMDVSTMCDWVSVSMCVHVRVSTASWVWLMQWTRELSRPIIKGQQLLPREARYIHKDASHCSTHTDTHAQRRSVFTLTVQSGALASEECLSQSVPSRCVSIDNGCVKYYNKQNSKMVLACQQLQYFNHVCRLLAEMENFPLKQKTPFSLPV